jgi:asparagine synthase (glutamine-hydrolysing)
VFRYGAADIERHLLDMAHCHYGGLVRSEARRLARDHLREFVRAALDDGFSAGDVLDLYYTFDRVRRWGGSNARKALPVGDRYSPFMSRAFVEAAFAAPAAARYTEVLHSRLIRRFDRRLHRMAITGHPWRREWPAAEFMRWMAAAPLRRMPAALRRRLAGRRPAGSPPAHDHAAWLGARREWLRGLCLDQPDSPLWDYVDRGVFERATAAGATDAEWRSRLAGLYHVGTLFAHRAWR